MPSAQVSVTDAYHCLYCSLSYINTGFGRSRPRIWPRGHLPDVYSAGPYPAINAPPPARYNNSLGYDGLPHQATVSVCL